MISRRTRCESVCVPAKSCFLCLHVGFYATVGVPTQNSLQQFACQQGEPLERASIVSFGTPKIACKFKNYIPVLDPVCIMCARDRSRVQDILFPGYFRLAAWGRHPGYSSYKNQCRRETLQLKFVSPRSQASLRMYTLNNTVLYTKTKTGQSH